MKRTDELELMYVKEVLDSEFRTSKGSMFNTRLEELVCSTYKTNYSIGHVNATAAMHTALLACGVNNNDEVIVPPLTMSSTAISVLQANATPIFADIEPDTFTVSPEAIIKCITKRTKAIIAVAIYGLMPNYDEIKKICKKYSLYLIEDNAECLMSKIKDNLCGSYGDFSCYSYQASKHLTCGNGGMLTCNSENLANKARKIANLGYTTVGAKKHNISKDDVQSPDFSRHEVLGYNYRLSEINAAVVLAQTEKYESLLDARIKCASLFDEVLSKSKYFKKQFVPTNYVHSYWCYTIKTETKNIKENWKTFRTIFLKNGGDPFYAAWKLSYKEPLFEKLNTELTWQKYENGLCPIAEDLQPKIIQLKTNYWDYNLAKTQAKILENSISEFEKNYD